MHTQYEHSPTVFAATTFRGRESPFGIKRGDRRAHMYLIGRTGTGKSTLLERLIRQDLKAGEVLALLDPHGDLAERIFISLPAFRAQDAIYFDPADPASQIGFNPLSGVPPSKRALAASGLVGVFKKLWHDSWGPRTEHVLRNALLTLLDQPQANLADALRLLTDPVYRRLALTQVRNLRVREFWTKEYEAYPLRLRAEVIAPVQNKIGAFLADPTLNRILTAQESSFNLRQIMDEGRILIVNLAKGRLGEDTSSLLGSLLVASIGVTALRRANSPEEARRDFYLYLDEFHNFTTLGLAGMLSELRKYRTNLVLANQYLSQLDPSVRDAILGNVGTLIAFRIGAADAELLGREFYPGFRVSDLVSLPNFHACMRLMIDGAVSEPFSARTLLPSFET
jgi:GTPase SAR1 family protein